MKSPTTRTQFSHIGSSQGRTLYGLSTAKIQITASSALLVCILSACSSQIDTAEVKRVKEGELAVLTEQPVTAQDAATRPTRIEIHQPRVSTQDHLADPEYLPARPQPEVSLIPSPAPAGQKSIEESALGTVTQLRGRVATDSADMSRDIASSHVYPRPVQPPVRKPEWGNLRIPHDGNKYAQSTQNPVIRVATQPVSTFAVDVDTGSYSIARRYIESGSLPPGDAVRIEEMINYFDYDYPLPTDVSQPFSVTTEVAPSPWVANRHLVHIGLKGFTPESIGIDRPAANLVFLIDVSGSMQDPNKLPLLKSSLRLLSKQLNENDRISIVVYAGASGVVLEPTPGNHWQAINQALSQLRAGGSTNGAAGIELAYQLARKTFIDKGINRVLLATDGDFNVGVSDTTRLKEIISRERGNRISLTTLGFGSGNYNDELMEQLADTGNGNYAYIDTLSEAQKVLIEELDSTLMTIAKDVKVQIEFNPAQVSEYRLIGYVNRKLANEDFANDKIDAGEIGAGHTVTALYEIALVNSGGELNTPLRYGNSYDNTQGSNDLQDSGTSGELLELRLRYKPLFDENGEDASNETGNAGKNNESHAAEKSLLVSKVVSADDVIEILTESSSRFRFSAAVAGFGQLLKGGKYTGDFSIDDIVELARGSLAADERGLRSEFVNLATLASGILPDAPQSASIRGESNNDLDKSDQSG